MSEARDQHIYRFLRQRPRIGRGVFIAPQACVSGDVELGEDVSVWPMAVIRGDVNRITIGDRCNIQDGAVLHVTHEGPYTPEGGPLVLGRDVTVGHGAILHACTIGNRCLVGMGAIVLDGAVVGDDVIIAAGAVVTPGTQIAAGSLWKGNPARFARPLLASETAMVAYNAAHYARLKDLYLEAPAHAGAPEAGAGG